MRQLRRRAPLLRRPVFPLLVAVTAVGCGYGFGNREFRNERKAAVTFAQALEARDTLRMRQLSWGVVRSGVSAIVRETPAAYTDFAKPAPELLTLAGGGIYGGTGSGEFLVESKRLSSCRGGIDLVVVRADTALGVASIRLVPPLDSITDDACRAAIHPT